MICLLGKCCTGKTTVLNELVKLGYKPIVSYTTRQPRPGELEGITYNYVSDKEFESMKEMGFFAETTAYEVYNGEIWKYGTARRDLTDDKVAIFNPEGIKNIMENKDLNIKVFLLFNSNGEIWNRLRQRGDNSEESARRIEADKRDFEGIEEYIDFAIKTDIPAEEVAGLIDEIYRRYK